MGYFGAPVPDLEKTEFLSFEFDGARPGLVRLSI
jgi:hypothetical protein